MTVLADVLALFDKWPLWKRMKESPDRLDELERRIAALETTPKKLPGKPCKKCGEPAVRLSSSKPNAIFGDMGGNDEVWTCGECGFSETIMAH